MRATLTGARRETAGEFATVRMGLGLTTAALAGWLGVRADTVRKWESGREIEDIMTTINIQEDTKAWTSPRDGSRRYYLTDEAKLRVAGLDIDRYKTGNICGATMDGESISNSRATRLVAAMASAWTDGTRFHGIADPDMAARFAAADITGAAATYQATPGQVESAVADLRQVLTMTDDPEAVRAGILSALDHLGVAA